MTARPRSSTATAGHDDSADRTRSRNSVTVELYLRTDTTSRLERHLLYAEDGTHALALTDLGRPVVVRGRDDLRRHCHQSVQVLPDWRWYDVQIIPAADPAVVWVECRGCGAIRFPGYEEGFYDNAFLILFTLGDDGRINSTREFSNPVEQMRALGLDVPVIARGWLPSEDADPHRAPVSAGQS